MTQFSAVMACGRITASEPACPGSGGPVVAAGGQEVKQVGN